jgi:hypothetical protein
MVLKKRGPRAAPKHDWRSEPEDPPVATVERVSPAAAELGSTALARKLAREADTLPPPPDTDPEVAAADAKDAQRTISGVRQKRRSEAPPIAATVDEVIADLRHDKRRDA